MLNWEVEQTTDGDTGKVFDGHRGHSRDRGVSWVEIEIGSEWHLDGFQVQRPGRVIESMG